MNADIGVGVSGDELNVAAQQVYSALYPTLFTGSSQVSYQGLDFTVSWNVQAAPQFDLTTPGDAETLAAVLRQRVQEHGQNVAALEEAFPGIAAAYPTFTMTFPSVQLTVSNGASTQLTLPFTAQCNIQVSGNTIALVPYQVTTPQQKDPVTNYLVQHVVVPQIQTILTNLLSGITIPPITVAGVTLSSPSVGIVDNALIAAANVQSSGTPPPPDGSTPWPLAPFFALLSPNLIQTLTAMAMASATDRFSDSGSGGDHWAGYSWSYSLGLTNPQTAIQGTSIAMSFSLTGSVSGGVEVVWVPLSIGFNANSIPNPSLTAGVQVSGNTVEIYTEQVNPFTIIVTPGGSIPSWVLGSLISAILTAVVASVTPLVTQFLGGIKIDSFTVPTYSISVSGKTLTLTPTNLQVGNLAGNLAVAGNITISG